MHNMASLAEAGPGNRGSMTLSPSEKAGSPRAHGRLDSFFLASPDATNASKKMYQVRPIVLGKRVNHQEIEHRSNLCRDSKGLFVSHVNMLVSKKLNKQATVLVDTASCVLYPMGSFRQKWDMLILALLVYVSLFTPLQIAFFEQDFATLEDWMGWFIMDLIIDVVFIVDIVLNFRTAWMSKDAEDYGRYVFDAGNAARRYCKGWFTVDLLSVIPFYFIDIYLLYSDIPASAASSIVRVPKMLKMVRLAKLLRVLRASQIFKRWDQWMAQRVQIGCTKLVKSMILFIWMLHLLACIWYFSASFEEDIRLAWMSKLPASQQASGYDLYMASLHWATMTLTTIGYGDIVPMTSTERIICFIGQILGVLVSAYVIGTVVLLVQSFIRRSTDFQRSMDAMQDFLKAAGVNNKMRKRCTTYCFYAQSQRKSYSDMRDIRSAMAMFSPALKADLAFQVNKKFFSECHLFIDTPLPLQVLKQMCLAFEPIVFGPHEYVARKGHFCNGAYFITRGKLQLEHWVNQAYSVPTPTDDIAYSVAHRLNLKMTPTGTTDDEIGIANVDGYDSVLYTRILEKNLSIGTASLFWQCYWYHYYRALGFCELIVLRQNDFRKMRIYKEFPVSYGVLKAAVARMRWRQIFSLLLMVPKSKLQKIQEKILVKGLADPHQTTNDVRSYSPVPLARTPSDNGRRQRDTLGSYSPTAEDLLNHGARSGEPPSPASSNRRPSVMQKQNAKIAKGIDQLVKAQYAMQQQINTLSKALLGDQNGAQNSRRSPPDKGSNRSSGRPPTPSSTRNSAGRSQPRHLQRHSSKRRVGVSSPQSLDGQSRSGYSKGNSSEDPGEQSKPHKDSADDQSSDESQDLTERDLEIQTEDTLELALMRTESLTVSTSSENEDEPESKLQSTPVSSSGAAEL